MSHEPCTCLCSCEDCNTGFEYLDGTSAVRIEGDEPSPEEVADLLAYSSVEERFDFVALLEATVYSEGEDAGEIVMRSPVVLKVWRLPYGCYKADDALAIDSRTLDD